MSPAAPRGAGRGGCGRRAAAVGLSLLLTALVLEGAFRWLDVRGWHEPRQIDWEAIQLPPERSLPGVTIQLEPHGEFQTRYPSDPRGSFDPGNSLTYRLNERGMRGPDYPRAKPAGTVRVMVLGDSFALGEGVRLEDTFVARLERRLAARLGDGPRIEVMNFSVPGWSTTDEINYLAGVGLEYEPDVILVAYVLNDAEYAAGLDLYDDFREQYEKRWLKHSYLASSLYAAVGRLLMARHYVDELVDSAKAERRKWERSLQHLSWGKRLAASIDARYAVAIFPFMYRLDGGYPFHELHELVAEHCAGDGIPVVDLFEAYRGHPHTSLWVHPSDQHPNEIGHRIAAEALERFLVDGGLLDEALAGAARATPPGRGAEGAGAEGAGAAEAGSR